MEVIKWVGEHSNKVRAAVWSTVLLLVALGITHLTDVQLGAFGLFLSNALDLFVESNTVSRVRVGERITDEVAKGVDKELVARTGTGTGYTNGSGAFTRPGGILILLLAAGSLMACAKAAPVLVAADNGVHSSLLRAKSTIDILCSERKPLLSVDSCKSLYSTMTPALEAGKAFNRSARDGSFEGLVDLATKVSRLMEAVRLVPANLRGNLELDLRAALGFAVR